MRLERSKKKREKKRKKTFKNRGKVNSRLTTVKLRPIPNIWDKSPLPA